MSWITHILTTWTTTHFILVAIILAGSLFLGLQIWRALGQRKLDLKSSPAALEEPLTEVNLDPGKPEITRDVDLSSEPKPYLIEIVVIGQGLNHHKKLRGSSLDFEYKRGEDETIYKVSAGRVYRKNPGLLDQVVWRLKGISAEYMALFWQGEPEPVYMERSAVNPEVLARVRTSRALGKALKEMFKSSILDNRGLIFFIIAFSVLAIVILRSMGYV